MFPSDRGNVAKPVRMALGSLMIQTRCGFTDRETVQQITENPYLQYFIGLKEYRLTRPFTPVAMVKFRKRFNAKRLAQINERIIAFETTQKALESDVENQRDTLIPTLTHWAGNLLSGLWPDVAGVGSPE